MRTIIIISVLILTLFCGCHKIDVGYLDTEYAVYTPDSTVIRKRLDPELDKLRIDNQTPWATLQIQGVRGTDPIFYEIESVKAYDGGDAVMFKKELSIVGGGIMYYPLQSDILRGRYIVSIRIHNEGYSHIKKDIFTFIVQ